MYKHQYPKICNFMPMQVMYRGHLLSRTLLMFELVALIAPQELKCDFFELLKTYGSFIFNCFCGPTGYAGEAAGKWRFLYISSYLEARSFQNEAIQSVQRAYVKFNQALLMNRYKSFDGYSGANFL